MTHAHQGRGPEGDGGRTDPADPEAADAETAEPGAAEPGAASGSAGARGGRRRERREQTRAALLAAAERLWAERGIHGASLDDVAAAAGLTKGAVYSNFTGKTDLVLALMEECTRAQIGTGICEELQSRGDRRSPRAGGAYGRRGSGESGSGESGSGESGSGESGSGEGPRLLALLLMEFWLYGMRDQPAGWRIADRYAERRTQVARELEEADGITPADRATLAMALDTGLALQHLLDPERVPAELYATGIRLVLGNALP